MTSTHHVWSGITVDCVDPARLGLFWGELLGLVGSEPLPGWVRLGELGGRSLDQRYDYDEGVVLTMADPEGNEFCIVQYFVA